MRLHTTTKWLALAALLTVALTAALTAQKPTLAVSPRTVTVAVLDTARGVTATPRTLNGATSSSSPITWSTSPAGIVAVVTAGTVRHAAVIAGLAPGTAWAIATWQTFPGTTHRVTCNGQQLVVLDLVTLRDSIQVTVTSRAVPRPLGTAEPGYDPAIGTLVMQDNMDAYTTAIDMGAAVKPVGPKIVPLPSPYGNSSPVSPSTLVISPGRNGTGKALRMAFEGIYQSSATFYTVNVAARPNLLTHNWTYWARVNYQTPDPGLAVKWFEAWHVNRTNTRIQWALHNHLPWTGGNLATYWQVFDQGQTVSQGTQPVGPYWKDIADNQWHRFTYTFRPNSAAGARDGFTRMWIDGVKVIDISLATAGVTPPGGQKVWCNVDDIDMLANNDGISQLLWGSDQTTSTAPWTYDIDDFTWWVTP